MQSIKPLNFRNVTVNGGFWGHFIKINLKNTIPHVYEKCKETGRIDAFRLGWKEGKGIKPHIFWDSDVAKWVESASYSLVTNYDPELDRLVDEVVELIVNSQSPDGYINSYYNSVEPNKRWTNLRDNHELYCAGHLIEAAVAHYEATGKRILLDAVCRYADYIATVFGIEPGKKRGYPGHEEIELALVKLYKATCNKKYLDLASYFINERGKAPHYYDIEAKERGETPGKNSQSYSHYQAHIPVREQKEVVGHAVRAMYLYSAMADLARETGDKSLADVCIELWNDLTTKKMYITGGIGSTGQNEGFTTGYDLPNDTAYAETCAAIGVVLFAHRMLQIDCDRRYSDVMERALYNGVISGISLDGKRFFYVNPLASKGAHHRKEWFSCACCPPNITRLISSIGGYIYSFDEKSVIVHLYVNSTGTFTINGNKVVLKQDTQYPWNGKIRISIDAETAGAQFSLRLRIPGWCNNYSAKINGIEIKNNTQNIEKGYLTINRLWTKGDIVELDFSMPIQIIECNPNVDANVGRVALQRGPIVYCIEQADNPLALEKIFLPGNGSFETIKGNTLLKSYEGLFKETEELLNNVVVIKADAYMVDDRGWDGILYRQKKDKNHNRFISFSLKAIPYFLWDNRTEGEMAVWIKSIDS